MVLIMHDSNYDLSLTLIANKNGELRRFINNPEINREEKIKVLTYIKDYLIPYRMAQARLERGYFLWAIQSYEEKIKSYKDCYSIRRLYKACLNDAKLQLKEVSKKLRSFRATYDYISRKLNEI